MIIRISSTESLLENNNLEEIRVLVDNTMRTENNMAGIRMSRPLDSSTSMGLGSMIAFTALRCPVSRIDKWRATEWRASGNLMMVDYPGLKREPGIQDVVKPSARGSDILSKLASPIYCVERLTKVRCFGKQRVVLCYTGILFVRPYSLDGWQ